MRMEWSKLEMLSDWDACLTQNEGEGKCSWVETV